MRLRSLRATLLFAAIAIATFLACNVWSSLDACSSDSECASGQCDPVGHFCLASDAATPPNETSVPPDVRDAAPPVDAADAAVPRCRPDDPFTSITRVQGFEDRPTIAARLASDEGTLLFSGLTGCTDFNCYDLYVSHRIDGGPFGAPSLVPAVNCDTAAEFWPTLSADAKLIFFESSRAAVPIAGACGSDISRIWTATRVNVATEFNPPRVDTIFRSDGGYYDSAPYLHPSGRSLYFVSQGRTDPGGQDIWVAGIDNVGFITQIAPVTAVNTVEEENFPIISLDDKSLYFARLQPYDGVPEHAAYHDIWVTTRPSPSDKFGPPRLVTELATDADEIDAWLSDDQCRLYFTSTREATATDGGALLDDYRLWVAERRPHF